MTVRRCLLLLTMLQSLRSWHGWRFVDVARIRSLEAGGAFSEPRRPWRMEKFGIWEVPMSVSPYLRLPLIGTVLLAGPEPIAS